MSFQNEPISIDKHITKTIDNSNKLPTSNAVQEFVTSKTLILNTIDSTVTDESNNLITSNAVHDFTTGKIAEALASLKDNSSELGIVAGTYVGTGGWGETQTIVLGFRPSAVEVFDMYAVGSARTYHPVTADDIQLHYDEYYAGNKYIKKGQARVNHLFTNNTINIHDEVAENDDGEYVTARFPALGIVDNGFVVGNGEYGVDTTDLAASALSTTYYLDTYVTYRLNRDGKTYAYIAWK